MYLVDTSVWIDWLRKKDTQSVKYFTNILDHGVSFGITGIIYQEILQGASSEESFNELVEYLGTQQFYDACRDGKTSHHLAAKLYHDGRRQGITIRSAIDCLIAQVAIEHDLILLHDDIDFVRIANVAPELKLYPTKVAVHYSIHER